MFLLFVCLILIIIFAMKKKTIEIIANVIVAALTALLTSLGLN